MRQPGAYNDGSLGVFAQPGAYHSGTLGMLRTAPSERSRPSSAALQMASAANKAAARAGCFGSCTRAAPVAAAACIKSCGRAYPLGDNAALENATSAWPLAILIVGIMGMSWIALRAD